VCKEYFTISSWNGQGSSGLKLNKKYFLTTTYVKMVFKIVPYDLSLTYQIAILDILNSTQNSDNFSVFWLIGFSHGNKL
jgi:hypothetical protein